MTKQAHHFALGSVSHGTLKEDELLTAFADELESRARDSDKNTEAVRELIANARAYAILLTSDHLNDDGRDYVSELVNELQEALTELAPPYVHFGTHEGDGSDFGFWLSFEALEEAVRDGEVLKVSDWTAIPGEYRGLIMHVSDHGNVTLYTTNADSTFARQGAIELWSIV